MKVLFINSVSGQGSTGKICKDLCEELIKQNHNSKIAFGQGENNAEYSFKFTFNLENHLHNLGSRIFGKQGSFSYFSTKNLIQYIQQYEPDIIHLHNLHGNYLNLNLLFRFLSKNNSKIVITLHDCWLFTGKCSHYTEVSCNKWQKECHHCPQLNTYPPSIFFDFSKELFNKKKYLLENINNLEIITVSKWLEKEVRKSFLYKKNIQTIYNWIDTGQFKYTFQEKLYQKLGIESEKFKILCVSASWNGNDKRFKNLFKLCELLGDDHEIIVVGKLSNNAQLHKNTKHIEYLNSAVDLAAIYSYADVYIHLSTEDTFGKVIAEALSCGTPAIVFNSTACPEIIGENCGYVFEKNDFNALLNSIHEIKKRGREYYHKYCRNHVLKNFEKSTNIQKTIELYQDILNAH